MFFLTCDFPRRWAAADTAVRHCSIHKVSCGDPELQPDSSGKFGLLSALYYPDLTCKLSTNWQSGNMMKSVSMSTASVQREWAAEFDLILKCILTRRVGLALDSF